MGFYLWQDDKLERQNDIFSGFWQEWGAILTKSMVGRGRIKKVEGIKKGWEKRGDLIDLTGDEWQKSREDRGERGKLSYLIIKIKISQTASKSLYSRFIVALLTSCSLVKLEEGNTELRQNQILPVFWNKLIQFNKRPIIL